MVMRVAYDKTKMYLITNTVYAQKYFCFNTVWRLNSSDGISMIMIIVIVIVIIIVLFQFVISLSFVPVLLLLLLLLLLPLYEDSATLKLSYLHPVATNK